MHPVPPDWALKGAGTNRVQEDEDKHPDRKGKDINKDGNDVLSFLSFFLLHYCIMTTARVRKAIMMVDKSYHIISCHTTNQINLPTLAICTNQFDSTLKIYPLCQHYC